MKHIGIFALLLTAPAWAEQKPASSTPGQAQTLPEAAEQKTENKMAQELQQGTTFAEATLAPRSGSKVSGTVLFNRGPKGLQVIASITGAPAGKHGIHIHEKGDCSAKDASSAGGHYNPLGAPHAGPETAARHVGDLGNITAKKDGVGYLMLDLPEVKGFTNWDDIIGKSVVVHAKGDDMKSQPAGASGDRIACGVIQAAATPNAQSKPAPK